jgi:hydroxymethylbilane synthase
MACSQRIVGSRWLDTFGVVAYSRPIPQVSMRNQLVIGTRKSPLALWQSEFVKAQLEAAHPGLVVTLKHVVTMGDKTQDSKAAIPSIGGKGLFTAELEECLVRGEIDIAVHSLKDLPTVIDPRFVVGAIPKRSFVEDVVVTRSGNKLLELHEGATIGTSSVRRSSQILRLRPDFKISLIRGNVDTRLKKLRAEGGEYDATLLARAGLSRLGLEREITQILTEEEMLPAPGQGALGIECRAEDAELLTMLSNLHCAKTAAEVTAERTFLHMLGAGCNTPVAARATVVDGKRLLFVGRCLSPDGRQCLEVHGEDGLELAAHLGELMAQKAFEKGFKSLCAA